MEAVAETFKPIYIITCILVEIGIILYGIGTIMILKSYRDKEKKEISQEEIRQHIIDYKYGGNPVEIGKYYGETYFDEQTIYIDKDLNQEQKKFTLMHELGHCYIGTFITHQDKQYDEEMVADIVSNSHYIIHKIVEEYFKGDILKEVSE